MSVGVFGVVVMVLMGAGLGVAQEKCTAATPGVHQPPDYYITLKGPYTLLLEMTILPDNVTYYVEEVRNLQLLHDTLSDTTAVYIRMNGSDVVVHYYPETNTFVNQDNDLCRESGLDEPSFAPWGWYIAEQGNRSYGPATLLRQAHFIDKEFVVAADVDGVMVERFRACEADGAVEIIYSYSQIPWDMPEQSWFGEGDDRLPVQFQVTMKDNSHTFLYHVIKFQPSVDDNHLLEVPRGMSCEGIVGVQHIPVPDMPDHFSLAQEMVVNPKIDGVTFGPQYLEKVTVGYSYKLSLVRLGMTPSNRKHGLSDYTLDVVQDFNTGVQYTINREFGNCSMDFIPPFGFDVTFGGQAAGGAMLTPNEFFHLDDNYGYVGPHGSREVKADLFTSTRDDILDPANPVQNLPKAVLEYYFSQGTEVTPNGRIPLTMPLRSDLFMYNHSNPHQVTRSSTSNFYDFKEVPRFTAMEYSVEECFERHSDEWSYLMIIFPAPTHDHLAALQKKPDVLKHNVFRLIVTQASVSPVRIAAIELTEGLSGLVPNSSNSDVVYASVKFLDRAPYIYSYRQPEDEALQRPGINEKSFDNIQNLEDCARLCSQDKAISCKSFHYCDGQVCFLSSLEAADGRPVEEVKECHHWLSFVTNETFVDAPSSEVYDTILDAIRHSQFTFDVPFKNATVTFEASMSFHYRNPDPFDPIRRQFTLEARSQTITKADHIQEGVQELDACLALCVSWKEFRCETVVYKPKNEDCLLIATHFHMINASLIKPESDSWIHSRSYLSDYKPVLGGVSLNTTGPIYTNVDHLEECARFCSVEDSVACQSFEWCHEEGVCRLHQEHFLDVADGGNVAIHTSCVHFSLKTDQVFSRYPNQGLPLAQHRLVAANTDSATCALLCVAETGDACESFDMCSQCGKGESAVCGADNEGQRNLCFLSHVHIGQPGVNLVPAAHCNHWSRDFFGDQDYANWVAQQRRQDRPYTAGDMTGLAFGMIFLGILMALAFLFGLTMVRPSTVPKDFTISFTNLKSSQESKA